MEKLLNWEITNNRFVTFIDIMGFKDLVFRNNHESVLEKMRTLMLAIDPIKNVAIRKLKGEGKEDWTKSIIRPIIFSDSIMLISNDDSPESAHDILFSTQWLISGALNVGIPIKGAIAHGQQTADFEKRLYILGNL